MAVIRISRQALARMPGYLQYLTMIRALGRESVTASEIAQALRLNDVQVRKDISAVSRRHGKPMVGFDLKELIEDMNTYLSYENVKDTVLVGTGALGSALLNYSGFEGYGLNIAAAFDRSPALIGTVIGGKKVYSIKEMPHVCRRSNILMGIITVPDHAAQDVCDQLVACGVRAIWNFAPVRLNVPEGVILQNENLVSSLTVLSRRLAEKLALNEQEKESR